MVHKIRIYGDPVLRKSAETVTEFDDKIRGLADDLAETMYSEFNGVGLAAPQIGYSKRLIVIDLSYGEQKDGLITLINPEIIEAEGENILEEGCLSVPEIYENVARAQRIKVRFRNLDGDEQEMDVEDFLARVIQHESDHLDGILFIDRLSTVKRNILAKTLRELAREGKNS